jgi:hypothetical protein
MTSGGLPTAVSVFIDHLHVSAVALALVVPLARFLVFKWFVKGSGSGGIGVKYRLTNAVHDGLTGASLPSCLALVLSLQWSEIASQVNQYEFFAIGLLGFLHGIATLFSIEEH